jgi:hypothetical protein
VAVVAVSSTLIAAAAIVQHVREGRYPEPPVTQQSLYLTSGAAARRLSIGYTALAADLYWIRAIQYYGNTKLHLADAPSADRSVASGADGYELLYPLLDLTTTLDPRFNIAYRFGSIFLAEPSPNGANRPDLAVALLEKGLRERPDKWEYMQDIGFVHYWWRHDYRTAAGWFQRASEVPGAPWFLRSLAAVTLAEGGDRQSSRAMWQAIRQSAEIDWQRNDAARRLQQLDAADGIDTLQQAINARWGTGRKVAGWQELIRAGILRQAPVDPTGTPLMIDDEAHVYLSPGSPLYPLPDEPRRSVATPS